MIDDTRITRLASETYQKMTPGCVSPGCLNPECPACQRDIRTIAAALTDLARQIREEDAPYMTHKGDCRALYPIHDDCTCGLTALRARTEEGS
jgi:hypothetical protein